MIVEMVFGLVLVMEWVGFKWLVDWFDWDDVLIVIKFDWFGCNVMDVWVMVEWLVVECVCVYCLVLGGVDLISVVGKMIMVVIGVVVEFECDFFIECI